MWHEARRQEKIMRKQLDGSKRHERRRKYYENVRSDPEQFMQIHGRKCHIYMDSTAITAESPNVLRKWGDPEILIDRFDVRSHLDRVPESEKSNYRLGEMELVEEMQCDFERYRILVMNEFQKVQEETFLKQIGIKEFWSGNTSKPEEKKKPKEKKAAIGYSYGDSEVVSTSRTSPSDSENEEEMEQFGEYDANFDVNALTAEKAAELNRMGQSFGNLQNGFLDLLKIDQKEQTEFAQIKEIDKAKLALSGRHAKADRARLKRQRALIVGKVDRNEAATTTLLSLMRKGKESKRRPSASSSDSDSNAEESSFITTLNGDYSKPIANIPQISIPLSIRSTSPRTDTLRKRSESPDFGGESAPISHINVGNPSSSSDHTRPTRERSSSFSDSDEVLEIRSSMSDSEKEKMEIENRKRRIRKTKRMAEGRNRRRSSSRSADEDSRKGTEASLLRKQMQRKLEKRVAEMKAEERDKARESQNRQRERDELVSDEARALRQREREKKRELDEITRSPRNRSRSPLVRRRADRSRSRSPPRRRWDRSPSPRRHSRFSSHSSSSRSHYRRH